MMPVIVLIVLLAGGVAVASACYLIGQYIAARTVEKADRSLCDDLKGAGHVL